MASHREPGSFLALACVLAASPDPQPLSTLFHHELEALPRGAISQEFPEGDMTLVCPVPKAQRDQSKELDLGFCTPHPFLLPQST